MKRVLWFSRHTMTTEQYAALETKLGEPVDLVQVDKTIQSAYELQNEIAEADIIAIVAPINLQQQFLKLANGKPVIIAQSKRIPRGEDTNGEPQYEFVFEGWKQLMKIEVVMVDFC